VNALREDATGIFSILKSFAGNEKGDEGGREAFQQPRIEPKSRIEPWKD